MPAYSRIGSAGRALPAPLVGAAVARAARLSVGFDDTDAFGRTGGVLGAHWSTADGQMDEDALVCGTAPPSVIGCTDVDPCIMGADLLSLPAAGRNGSADLMPAVP